MPSVSPLAVPAAACKCRRAVAPGSWASAPSDRAPGSRRSSRQCLERPCWPSLVPVPSSDSYARLPLPWTAQSPSGFRHRFSPRGLRALGRRRFGLHPLPRCPSSARPDCSAAWPCEIAALLASSTVQAFVGLPRLLCPLLTSTLRSERLAAPAVPLPGQQRRPPEVRPIAFAARLPDLPPRPLMAVDFAAVSLLVRPGRPRYPVLVHQAAALLHASFRPHLAVGSACAELARISHTTECIGAPNQRKWLCHNDFRAIRGAPRCRQSVAQTGLDLHLLKDAKWWRRSTGARSPRMPARCFWGRRTMPSS